MKTSTALLALAVLALSLVLTPAAEAQVPIPYWSAQTSLSSFTPAYVPSYSYWTAAYYGYPPRIYVGYGSSANDFPYYGRPYGSPSDPWSWPAMAGNAAGVPTRYYVVLP
jgi:hypothetical protein